VSSGPRRSGTTLTAADADEHMKQGPLADGGPIDLAQAALLKAIRAQYLGSG